MAKTSLHTHTAVARLPGVSYRLSCCDRHVSMCRPSDRTVRLTPRGHVFTITSLELLARLQSNLTGNIVSRGKFTGSEHVSKSQNARWYILLHYTDLCCNVRSTVNEQTNQTIKTKTPYSSYYLQLYSVWATFVSMTKLEIQNLKIQNLKPP